MFGGARRSAQAPLEMSHAKRVEKDLQQVGREAAHRNHPSSASRGARLLVS